MVSVVLLMVISPSPDLMNDVNRFLLSDNGDYQPSMHLIHPCFVHMRYQLGWKNMDQCVPCGDGSLYRRLLLRSVGGIQESRYSWLVNQCVLALQFLTIPSCAKIFPVSLTDKIFSHQNLQCQQEVHHDICRKKPSPHHLTWSSCNT